MKIIALLFCLMIGNAVANIPILPGLEEEAHLFSTEIFRVSSDKASYAVGETAILQAELFTQPSNESLELDIVGVLNGEGIDVDRVTDYKMFSTVENLQAGTYTWSVEVFIQNKRHAEALKDTKKFYNKKIQEVDAQLAVETDPVIIAELQAERERLVDLRQGANKQLKNIRTFIQGPEEVTFTVQ